MISTVIFDLDGLLTDTERLRCQAWRETLAGVGVEVRGVSKRPRVSPECR